MRLKSFPIPDTGNISPSTYQQIALTLLRYALPGYFDNLFLPRHLHSIVYKGTAIFWTTLQLYIWPTAQISDSSHLTCLCITYCRCLLFNSKYIVEVSLGFWSCDRQSTEKDSDVFRIYWKQDLCCSKWFIHLPCAKLNCTVNPPLVKSFALSWPNSPCNSGFACCSPPLCWLNSLLRLVSLNTNQKVCSQNNITVDALFMDTWVSRHT